MPAGTKPGMQQLYGGLGFIIKFNKLIWFINIASGSVKCHA